MDHKHNTNVLRLLGKLFFFLMWAVGRSETTIEKVFFASFLWNVTFVMADAPRLEDMITRTHDSLSCDLQ